MISPARLSSVDTVFAMTVHKAQGSEFTAGGGGAAPVASAVLTRELLYTAVTRAREGLILAGSSSDRARAMPGAAVWSGASSLRALRA